MHRHSARVLSDGAGDLNRSVRSTLLDSRMQFSAAQSAIPGPRVRCVRSVLDYHTASLACTHD
jgi:hypothetical protein